MSARYDGFSAAPNNAVPTDPTVLVSETPGGPMTIVVTNVGDYPVTLQAKRSSDDTLVALAEETAVADEDTGYDGDTSELNFTGEALDNTPIVPGSVTVKPTAGGDSVNATDRDSDGKLYTSDDDEDECGTIDYATGDLTLYYPSGKAPNTGDIDADYQYSVLSVVGGKKTYSLTAFSAAEFEQMEFRVIGLGGASKARVEVFQSF